MNSHNFTNSISYLIAFKKGTFKIFLQPFDFILNVSHILSAEDKYVDEEYVSSIEGESDQQHVGDSDSKEQGVNQGMVRELKAITAMFKFKVNGECSKVSLRIFREVKLY